jgi:toxin ParE1/3/4
VKVVFGAPAAQELEEAIGWYERRRAGLGARFHAAVERTVQELSAHPQIGRARHDAKQLPVPGFPYVLVYEVMPHSIVIAAVAHTRRRPKYWRAV